MLPSIFLNDPVDFKVNGIIQCDKQCSQLWLYDRSIALGCHNWNAKRWVFINFQSNLLRDHLFTLYCIHLSIDLMDLDSCIPIR